MSITLTSREFNQDTARAKREAALGPVFVTDRGKPTHVLLTVEAFDRLAKPRRSILDMLAMPGMEDIEINFEDERDKSIPLPFDFEPEE